MKSLRDRAVSAALQLGFGLLVVGFLGCSMNPATLDLIHAYLGTPLSIALAAVLTIGVVALIRLVNPPLSHD